MSYQVLARKWRPRIFSEMAGQEHVLQALINALDNDRLHHAYLFTGTRGVGKTTIARILAKCLNCEEGVSSVPCGKCSACTGIAEGRFVDLIEVDAASRTKVEDTRELLDNVQYAPTAGRYKVYLIDEVHMLSGHSFNALLKTLEEPPPHVKFLLATTDPQKLPVTILSRCLQFNLKNLSPERIVEHLQFVLVEEKVPFEESGLWSLARAADGSMRDALSLTDQAIAHGGGKLTEAEISAMLGTIDLSAVIEIAEALSCRNAEQALALVETMAEHAPDFGAALAELISVWHRTAIAQVAPDALDNRHGDHRAIVGLADRLSREDVQLFYQIGLLARRDLPLAPDSKSGFEMALLRMLAFQPAGDVSIDPPKTEPSKAAVNEPSAPPEVVPSVKKPEPAFKAEPEPGLKHEPVADPEIVFESLEREREPETAEFEVDEAETDIGRQGETPEASVEMPSEEPPLEVSLSEEALPDPISTEQLRQLSRQAHQQDHQKESEQPQTTEPGAVYSTVFGDSPLEEPEQTAGLATLSELSPQSWIGVYQQLEVGGVIQNTAANLVLVERQENHLRFELDINNSSLYEEGHSARLQQVLSDYFGEAVTIDIIVGQVSTETPQANMLRLRAERQAAAVETMKSDANVKQMIERFDGQLLEHTVRPVD